MTAAAAVVLFLNHFFVVLDHETYAAIEGNAFLTRDFAPFERRTTVRNDRTYTGIYFYGTNTYFEFFDASNAGTFRKGTDGIALTPEEPGAIRRLAGLEPPELVTRKTGEVQVPWFWAADLKGLAQDAPIDAWVMEYHADFLAQWHAEASHGESGIARRSILSRYKAVLPSRPAASHFVDVREITIAADAATLAILRQHVPDAIVHFVPETTTKRGIVQVVLEVRDVPKRELRLGRSTLRFDGKGRAVWDF